jgi:hypothetical protein
VRTQLHLINGEHRVTPGVPEILLACGVTGLLVLAVWFLRRARPMFSKPTVLLFLCVLGYSAGIFYAGLRTYTTFSSRMFVPILPLYLLLLGAGLNWLRTRAAKAGNSYRRFMGASAAFLAIGYAGVNARSLQDKQPAPEHEVVAALLAAPSETGISLRRWIELHVPADSVIFAPLGQATGYALHHPTVSLIEPYYSEARWECDQVRREMLRFQSRYLVLYRPTTPAHDLPLLTDTRFVSSALRGPHPPCEFKIAAENSHARVLEMNGAAQNRP